MIPSVLSKQFIFKALEKTRYGKIKISIDNKLTEIFGEGPLVCEIRAKSFSTLGKVAVSGDLALAEAIISNDLEISNEAAFIEWACRNDEVLNHAFHGTWIGTMAARIKRVLRANTVAGAKKNIMAHYDLGNQFYQSWLDSSMSYSSAIFDSKTRNSDLATAQRNKYDRIIDELGIKSTDHVLEIGCGWGGFFSRAIERTGCKVTAVMNSPAQAEFNRELIQAKGLNLHNHSYP